MEIRLKLVMVAVVGAFPEGEENFVMDELKG